MPDTKQWQEQSNYCDTMQLSHRWNQPISIDHLTCSELRVHRDLRYSSWLARRTHVDYTCTSQTLSQSRKCFNRTGRTPNQELMPCPRASSLHQRIAGSQYNFQAVWSGLQSTGDNRSHWSWMPYVVKFPLRTKMKSHQVRPLRRSRPDSIQFYSRIEVF